jgi:uncharacterized protein YegL
MTPIAEPLCAYILVDCSASMSGAPFEALRQGVQVLLNAFERYNGRAVQAALLAFESAPILMTPLQAAHSEAFIADANQILATSEPAGASNLGKALRQLAAALPEGAMTALYLFSDGGFTDDWQSALAQVRPRLKCFYAVACGLSADREALSAADQVLSVDGLTADTLLTALRAIK